jgi:surface polysaccharide O-acyltransferase-like enzyme
MEKCIYSTGETYRECEWFDMDTNVSIRIFDKNINFLGEIDSYTSLFYISKWETYGEFEFHVNNFNKELLQKGNIIMLGKDGSRTGVIEHLEVNQDNNEDIVIKGFSLGYWLTNRVTSPPTGKAYHAFNTNVEDVMLQLVKTNTIDPLDINRKIPNLALDISKGRGIKLEFQTRYKNLSEELTKLSKTSGLGWAITLDYKSKKFIFKVLEGKNLSTEQSINPPQIFSVDYDNIRKQNYLESNIGYKNMAYVAGQGEGDKREIELLNSNLVGFDRRETFIDARDISEGGNLIDRGKIKHILCIQQFKGGLKGIGHLWFISFIIICYLLTPILQSLYDNLMKDKKEVKFWGVLFFIIIFIQFIKKVGLIVINVPNLSCYILGYFISRRYYNTKYINSNDRLSLLQTTMVFTIASILSNGIVIYYRYYRKMENMAAGNLFFDFSHMLLGISLFFIMYSIFNNIDKRFINGRIIDCMDRYSFEIYIVHHIYILGRFSLMNLTNSLWINIIIVVIAIMISAFALKHITNFIMKVISQLVSNIKGKNLIH